MQAELGASSHQLGQGSTLPEHLQPVLNGLPEQLTDHERKVAKKLVFDNADVFSTGEFDLGQNGLV